MSSYHTQKEDEILDDIERVKSKLPSFCNRFFLGITHTTSAQTRLAYAYDLNMFFEFLRTEIDIFVGKSNVDIKFEHLKEITTMHIEIFINHVRNHEKAIMRKLSCLRSFFNYYYKRNELEQNIVTKIDMPKLTEKPIIRLDRDEVGDLIDIVSFGDKLTKGQQKFHDINSLRDITILYFFLGTGIRVSELVGLNIGDIDFANKSFKVTRKGGNQVILYMPDELVEQLELYLGFNNTDNSKKFTISQSVLNQPLFKSIQNKRLGVRSVQNLVSKYAKLAVPLKNISPHKLRSTFGTNLYRSTKDIYVVADVLGHKDVNTTKKHYAQLTDDIRRDAAQKVKIHKPN